MLEAGKRRVRTHTYVDHAFGWKFNELAEADSHAAAILGKADAVNDAVEDQLTHDGHAPPHNPGAVMQDDLGYAAATVQGFLLAVANRLLSARYTFDPGSIPPQDALGMQVRELKLAIWKLTR